MRGGTNGVCPCVLVLSEHMEAMGQGEGGGDRVAVMVHWCLCICSVCVSAAVFAWC